jgi:hypothetical protein
MSTRTRLATVVLATVQLSAAQTGPYTLIHSDGECNSDDQNLGTQDSVQACADACVATPGCRYFVYSDLLNSRPADHLLTRHAFAHPLLNSGQLRQGAQAGPMLL